MLKTILNAIKLTTAEFEAAATDVITDAAHGLSNGDALVLTTTDTLPAGLATETIYYVIKATTNTFKLSMDKPDSNGDGVPVDITDTGTGTHTYTISNVGEPVLAADYQHKQLTISTDGMGAGDQVIIKVQMSNEEEAPDWHKAKSLTNNWDYVQKITLEDGSSVDGDTGIVIAAADDVITFAFNVDGGRWFNLVVTEQTDVANTTVTGKIALTKKFNN